jgi:hypothetical protein
LFGKLGDPLCLIVGESVFDLIIFGINGSWEPELNELIVSLGWVNLDLESWKSSLSLVLVSLEVWSQVVNDLELEFLVGEGSTRALGLNEELEDLSLVVVVQDLDISSGLINFDGFGSSDIKWSSLSIRCEFEALD